MHFCDIVRKSLSPFICRLWVCKVKMCSTPPDILYLIISTLPETGSNTNSGFSFSAGEISLDVQMNESHSILTANTKLPAI